MYVRKPEVSDKCDYNTNSTEWTFQPNKRYTPSAAKHLHPLHRVYLVKCVHVTNVATIPLLRCWKTRVEGQGCGYSSAVLMFEWEEGSAYCARSGRRPQYGQLGAGIPCPDLSVWWGRKTLQGNTSKHSLPLAMWQSSSSTQYCLNYWLLANVYAMYGISCRFSVNGIPGWVYAEKPQTAQTIRFGEVYTVQL